MSKKLLLPLQGGSSSRRVHLKQSLLFLFSFILLPASVLAQAPAFPFVDAGADIELECGVECTDLTATFVDTGETTSYAVTEIDYAPPFPFTGGTPVSVNTDDVWSPRINMPFEFCFFGEVYDEMLVGSNGVVTFDLIRNNPGGDCEWSFSESIPNPNLFRSTIFGPYMDINPRVSSGQINWSVHGEAPARTMVINFPNQKYFGSQCSQLELTSQIVVYETTNVIDVYIKERPDGCSSWNSGNAVIGIQNETGTQGYTPPGRNTGNWEAFEEAWRFIPNGDSNVDFVWLDANGEVISNDATINVCPTEEVTVYTAQATYTNCNGDVVIESDEVTVTRTAGFTVDLGDNIELCDINSHEITAEITGGNPADASFLWSTGETTQSITVTQSGTYSVEVTIGECTISKSVDIKMTDSPRIDLGEDFTICSFDEVYLDATPSNHNPDDVTYQWSFNGVVIDGEEDPILQVLQIGTYSVVVSIESCSTTDEITLTTGSDLEISLGEDFKLCAKETYTLNAITDEEGITYEWFLNGELMAGETGSSIEIMFSEREIGSRIYTVTISKGDCTQSASVDVSTYDVGNCVISKGISPGSDGFNDSLDLTFLHERTGINKLQIFNRLGKLVFDQNNYINQWKGQTNDDKDLPTGTYYYVIDLSGEDSVYGSQATGWIYLNQEAN